MEKDTAVSIVTPVRYARAIAINSFRPVAGSHQTYTHAVILMQCLIQIAQGYRTNCFFLPAWVQMRTCRRSLYVRFHHRVL